MDALVLGGGGILGEAWMNAVLAGIEQASEDGFDARACEAYVGTSAGSIVAAALANGLRPRARLGDLPQQPPAVNGAPTGAASGGALRLVRGAAGVPAALALRSTAPGGALVRRVALGRVRRGRRSLGGLGGEFDGRGARFDGRLRISAVDLASGRRVMFGAPGAPPATVGQAVEASCAIPGYFKPVRIGGRDYVDGGAWSPTNADTVTVRRGMRVLVLNPTGSLRGLGVVSRSIASFEALTLERRGADVTLVSPDAGVRAAMGSNLMDSRPRAAVIEAGFAQGHGLARRVAAA